MSRARRRKASRVSKSKGKRRPKTIKQLPDDSTRMAAKPSRYLAQSQIHFLKTPGESSAKTSFWVFTKWALAIFLSIMTAFYIFKLTNLVGPMATIQAENKRLNKEVERLNKEIEQLHGNRSWVRDTEELSENKNLREIIIIRTFKP